MKVVWSAWALQQLDEIHGWYWTQASPAVADGIVENVLSVTRLLEQFPFGGPIEPWLEHQGLGHRRVVIGNYKVVYRVLGDEVRIIDVFDSRQDPGKMKV
ncbi:MAG: type II toxin-antitoxin system RelE/ParE family toxin [Flavobacteriales bacterium]|nr:type II toxin-antitoxin system RelE/ParE family toxin [Flavobacteriales bacterium]